MGPRPPCCVAAWPGSMQVSTRSGDRQACMGLQLYGARLPAQCGAEVITLSQTTCPHQGTWFTPHSACACVASKGDCSQSLGSWRCYALPWMVTAANAAAPRGGLTVDARSPGRSLAGEGQPAPAPAGNAIAQQPSGRLAAVHQHDTGRTAAGHQAQERRTSMWGEGPPMPAAVAALLPQQEAASASIQALAALADDRDGSVLVSESLEFGKAADT